jgi:hypothetical protein
MDRRIQVIGVIGVVLAISGCQHLFGPQKPPEDPLFRLRRPAEIKAEAGPPMQIAVSEPLPPDQPFFDPNRPALARQPGARSVPGTLTNRPRTPPAP